MNSPQTIYERRPLCVLNIYSLKGYVVWQYPNCKGTHRFKITCKCRLCPACGKKYSSTWAENTTASLIDVKHRHVLFTIPKELREFFFYDRALLTKMAYAINDIFKYQFHNIKDKNKRVNKIGKYSKHYFTNSDIWFDYCYSYLWA